jgi:putative ABC transport system permease protein
MKNPLIKRVPRELKSDWHKYIVIIFFMILMIGVISGMYVGHDSMLSAIYSGQKDLNLEDGNFELTSKATDDLLDDLSDQSTKVDIYEHFYRNESEDVDLDGEEDATIRIYQSDSTIDQASFLEGRAPEKDTEIAIDRMHADNQDINIGDTIKVGDTEFEVVGLLSYVNYLTLHESNTDLMFDSFGFDVAMVTPAAFDDLTSRIHYNYAFTYDKTPEDEIEEADFSDKFREDLIELSYANGNPLQNYVPEYLNQASNFAPSDIDSDTTSSSILCYILIGVIAFIFAITISNTIEKESTVIGTLRASGYSKRELIVHYMSMPIIVTIIGAILGNILGYTAFRRIALNLYYNSYSLPSCDLVWSNTALIKTTIIPLFLMFFINLFIIIKRLQLSPLRFLRNDLTKVRREKARRLPKWSFLARFRLRILFQNLPNYLVLIFGVVFIELMLCFAFGLPDSLNYYSKTASSMMFADYQYVLMNHKDAMGNEITTSEDTAEKFSSKKLMYPKDLNATFEGYGSGEDEEVTVYGIEENSDYIALPKTLDADEVYISSAFSNKFDLEEGDTIKLHEEYEDQEYKFTVAGIIEYDGGIAVFLGNDNFNDIFDRDTDSFNGYFSQHEITDIDEQNIATTITAEDITKVTTQLQHSMGDMFVVFKFVLIALSAALIYLLAKIIIERNEKSISMVKILGFKNREIASLYILSTAIVIILFTVIGFLIGYQLMTWIFKMFILQMDGYFAYYMSFQSMLLSMLYLLIGYVFVSIIDFIRIKRIPMDVALKNID